MPEMAMHTRVIDGAARWAGDDVLCERLERIKPRPCEDAPPMCFGIKDGDGHVYRIIETTSLMEAIQLCGALRELGFVRCEGVRLRGIPLHRAYCPTRHPTSQPPANRPRVRSQQMAAEEGHRRADPAQGRRRAVETRHVAEQVAGEPAERLR